MEVEEEGILGGSFVSMYVQLSIFLCLQFVTAAWWFELFKVKGNFFAGPSLTGAFYQESSGVGVSRSLAKCLG